MENNVTLSKETLMRLAMLVDEIDREEDSEECDVDVVIEGLYKVLDVVRSIVTNINPLEELRNLLIEIDNAQD